MFPVKWNKLQLAVEINFVRNCAVGQGRRERENFNTDRSEGISRVGAVKHQKSPRFASSSCKTTERARESRKSLPDSTGKRRMILHHKHPVMIAPTPTRRYVVQSSWEKFGEEFLRREKSLRRTLARKRGKLCWGMEKRSGNRSSKSPSERKPKPLIAIQYSLPLFAVRWDHSISGNRKTINKGNDNQLKKQQTNPPRLLVNCFDW